MKKSLLLIFLLYSFSAYSQKFHGLAPTPPMDWSTWNTFKGDTNEQLIPEVKDIYWVRIDNVIDSLKYFISPTKPAKQETLIS